MRIRSIKPEFWRSEDVKQLPREIRLLFIGLWSYVDDNGVGIDDYRQIASDLGPLEDDPVEYRQYVRDGLATLSRQSRDISAKPLIARYEIDGKRYLYITGWNHQRVDKPAKPRYPLPPEGWTSENPDPPEDVAEPSGDCLDILVPGTGEQGNRGTGTKASPSLSRKRGTRIPDDFSVSPEMVAWAREHAPNIDGRVETENFRDYWRAKSGANATKLDWIATWRTWMRNAQQRTGSRNGLRAVGGSYQPYQNPTDTSGYYEDV